MNVWMRSWTKDLVATQDRADDAHVAWRRGKHRGAEHGLRTRACGGETARMSGTVPWCSALAYVPGKHEIAGSNPVGAARLIATDRATGEFARFMRQRARARVASTPRPSPVCTRRC